MSDTPPLEISISGDADDSDTCVVAVNRSVSPGAPAYFASPEEAAGNPLARKILQAGDLEAVLMGEDRLTLLKALDGEQWSVVTSRVSDLLREHFEALDHAGESADREMTDEEKEVALRVQEHLNAEINPMVASHGGFIEVLALKSTTLYINMAGGCQGCGMASVTLKQGVEQAVLPRFPEVERILDSTDHASGTNPFYAPTAK